MILARKKYDISDPQIIIEQKIRTGKLSSLLVIVPTNRKSRALKREFIAASGGIITGKINIDTIGTFTQKMLSVLAKLPLSILSEAASAVLLKRCFNTATLSYFNRYKSEVPPGTLSRIQNIIGEYKRHGITPEKLLIESKNLEGSERLKAEDIALVYSLYNDECRKSNSGETGDIYKTISNFSQEEFMDSFSVQYPEVDCVIINGFDEFTGPEVQIINNIPGKVLISFDYYDKNPAIFLHLQPCFTRFLSLGFQIITDVDPKKQNNFQEIIRKEYFSPDIPKEKYQFNITELTALNRSREVGIIAKEVKELLKKPGVQADRICIVFNLIQNYSPLIRNMFPVFGIPFNLTDRIPLSSAGPVTAVLSFLEIQETGFYYKSIFRALSSGFIFINNVSISELIKSASDLNIISGYDNWVQLLEERIRISEPSKKFIYNKALDSIVYLKAMLASLEERMIITDFRIKLLGLINTLNIPVNILSFKGETETHFKALSEFFDILEELFSLLVSEYGNERQFSLSFYLNEIRTAAENSRFNISEKPGYGVQVTNLNEIRGLSFDYLFIGGLIDGELPTRYTPEIFYSGSFSREEWKHQVEERYHFYQSLCAWEKGLYLTRPLQENNKELNPSNFLSELGNHFEIKKRTELEYSETLYSIEELQEYAGKNIRNSEIFNSLPYVDTAEIIKTLGIYNDRKNDAAESPYNGYIFKSLSEELQRMLNSSGGREYSVTQLELYAKCPFQYFLERILYLNVLEEPVEEIEPLELGTMIHKILYQFYKELIEKKIEMYQCSEIDFREAENMIFSIADQVIIEMTNRSPLNFLEMERLTGLNGKRENSILFKFISSERESNNGYFPFDFELPFGNFPDEEGRKNDDKEFLIEDIRIRGKIDRVDIDPAGSRIRVTDYKLSGKKPEVNELESGLSLQLPLYLYAAKEIISKRLKKDYTPAGADIYSLKYQDGKFGRKPIVSVGKKTEEEVRDEYQRIISVCIESIKKYAANISGGIFNLSALEEREKKACLYCNFKLVCRINE